MDVLDDLGYEPAHTQPPTGCDRCGARALVFTVVNGTELSYCGHHADEYLPNLMKVGIVVADLSHHPQP